MSLKEITKDLHTTAEKTKFMQLAIGGNLPKDLYISYLWQHVPIYSTIEFGASVQGFFSNLPNISRTKYILADFIELADPSIHHVWSQETLSYLRYLQDLLNDPLRKHLIKAHLYVHHLGVINGGQYIKRLVPGAGSMYEFDNLNFLKSEIIKELTDDLGPEARVAFEFVIKILEDLVPDELI